MGNIRIPCLFHEVVYEIRREEKEEGGGGVSGRRRIIIIQETSVNLYNSQL